MNATAPAPKSRRRWLPRFGLRTLLILVALCGVTFGYLGHLYRRVAHQRYIVAKIQEAGGTVKYNYQFGVEENAEEVYRSVKSTHIEGARDGRQKVSRKRIVAGQEVVEIETPPGPKWIRRLFGDDVFAYVASVDFLRFSKPPEEFNPRLLLELPGLRDVIIVGSQVNCDWLKYIAQIPSLRVVVLIGDKSTNPPVDCLDHLESAKKLQALSISGDWVRDETVSCVHNLRNLTLLTVSRAPNVTSAIFAQLDSLTDLQELNIIHNSNIGDEGTESLSRLRNLRVLCLRQTSVSDATLAHVSVLKDLEQLELSSTNVSDDGMKHLASLSQLTNLDLTHTRVGDLGLEYISRLPRVRYLRLGSTNTTDAGLLALARTTSLEQLYLWPCNISDSGLPPLKSLTNLKELNIGPDVTKEAAEELRAALPKCEIRRIDASGHSGYPDL
jgi:hypothetical protein